MPLVVTTWRGLAVFYDAIKYYFKAFEKLLNEKMLKIVSQEFSNLNLYAGFLAHESSLNYNSLILSKKRLPQ